MKNRILTLLIISALLLLFLSCGEKKTTNNDKTNPSFFKKGDKVVFVGNSITHMGMFHNNIYLYHITRFPEQPIEIFNMGVSGDVGTGVLNRMDDDILINKPTVATIMLGMNDVNRALYGTGITTDKDTLQKRKEAIDNYKKNLDSIVNIFRAKNIKLILERPSIYDQTVKLPEPNHLGVNDVLGECAVYIDSLGAKYNLPVVDYYTIMNRINLEIQEKDFSTTLTGADRIHPQETGHFIMAYQFLKTENAPKYVSKIIINAEELANTDESSNCEIGDIKKQENTLEFTVSEKALPFPVKEEQKDAIKLVPFMDEMNVELLKIVGLSAGNYTFKIDDTIVGEFAAQQLAEGLNLAEYSNTPQMVQAVGVRTRLEEMWKMEGKLRGMKFIEYMDDYKACPNKNDLKFVETFLDSVFSKYPDPYYINQLRTYVENKPKEAELKEKCAKIRKEIYALAKPKQHIFYVISQ